ncbi:CHAP domain-containing protein [Nonomuraea sp. NPDC059023]|uniref:CHAP domain-containing protein n=1 Tax=unclassified Nonomuraea TaxID=2593643 RepID=UPI003685BBC1
MPTVEDAGRELARHLGYREAGTNLTPFNREFGAIPGYPHGGLGYPWCHTFVSVGLKRAGLTANEDFPWTAGCETGVAWFKRRGRFGTTPRPGALVYYGPRGGTHVEWVEKVTAAAIVTIGGNTSGALAGAYFNGDGVYRKTIARTSSRIYGYGYPIYEEDDDVSAKDVWSLEIPVPFGSPGNPEWQAKNIMVNTAAWVRELRERTARLEAKLDGQNATITALAEALAAQNATLDVEQLLARIRAEIESVTVRLDIPDTPTA